MILRLVIVFTILLTPFTAAATSRVAFVVGNGTYENAPPLPNPTNDAALVARTLDDLGFEVSRHTNLSRWEIAAELSIFLRETEGADLTLFYFAGHGMQFEGRNYLLGTDARLRSELDIQAEALDLNQITRLLRKNSRAALIFVDACRDNPVATDFYRRTLPATRSASMRGLAGPTERFNGAMVTFSASPGQVAYDGRGAYSPFAQALAKHLPTPNIEILTLMKRVIGDVRSETNELQVPMVSNDLSQEIYLREVALAAPASDIAETFSIADQAGTLEAWTSFLNAYSDRSGHPLLRLAESRRAALLSSRKAPSWGSSLLTETDTIQSELKAFAAAERLASPRGWALFFDRFPAGRLSVGALAREERAFRDDLAAREFGRYRSARDGETLTPALVYRATEALKLDRQTIMEVQRSLGSRGVDAGQVDGVIGSRTRTALSNFQRTRGLPVSGLPTRATIAALGIYNKSRPMADMHPVSGAMSKVIDAEAASELERDPRLDRLLDVIGTRPLIYGFFDGSLYAAVYLGTTYGEGALNELLEKTNAQLVEFGSAEEEAFVFDMVRYDQKLWGSKGDRITKEDGPTIGLTLENGQWSWRSQARLAINNWASGEPRQLPEQTELRRAYGRFVPIGSLSVNGTRVDRAGWAADTQISPTVILEIR